LYINETGWISLVTKIRTCKLSEQCEMWKTEHHRNKIRNTWEVKLVCLKQTIETTILENSVGAWINFRSGHHPRSNLVENEKHDGICFRNKCNNYTIIIPTKCTRFLLLKSQDITICNFFLYFCPYMFQPAWHVTTIF
jgi:hypothetical protein